MAAADRADHEDTADLVRAILNSLVRERQALRYAGADEATLQANRIAIVYWQQELSKRLIAMSAR